MPYISNDKIEHLSLDQPIVPPNPFPEDIDGSTEFADFHIFYFKDALHFCAETGTDNCKKWNVDTAEWIDLSSRPLKTETGGYRLIEINGKMWMTGGGGWNTEVASTNFMDANGVWTAGPNLPEANRLHNLVALSDHEVLYFGGYAFGSPRWITYIYNDQTGTFTAKAGYSDPKYGTAAAKIRFSDDRDVVLAVSSEGKKVVEIYDIAANKWEIRPDLVFPLFRNHHIPLVVDNRYTRFEVF